MCGIVGIINIKDEDTNQAQYIHLMADEIKHRGPDDEGYILFQKDKCTLLKGDDTLVKTGVEKDVSFEHIVDNYHLTSRIAFGHRRLSIFDLSFAGHQPMEYMKRYWIVYNGEIYNYIEIKNDLKKHGYEFNSTSDTEVIMAAYDYWGVECLSMFNGMWAFTLYDTYKNRLFISRDRFGKKPLYYYKDDYVFIFASEIKALLNHPGVKTEPNIDYCIKYLDDGPREYIRETAFENIYHFMHSSYVEIDVNDLQKSDIKEKVFWKIKTNYSREKFDKEKADKYADKYLEILGDAVRIRLRADVKVGAALSGGLDSSTIVYLINKHLKKKGKSEKLETFSSVYKSTEGVRNCDESEFIDELSIYLNVKSNQIEPKISEIIEEHGKMIYAMENPAVGPNMGGWYTFKLVGVSDVTINLDGQGADEQLAGYYSYLWRFFANIRLTEIFGEYKAFSRIPGVQKSKILVSICLNLIRRLFTEKMVSRITGKIGMKYNLPITAPVNQMLNESVMTGLINLIHFGDSQSMAHSIESRLPFMDYRVVEFLASVPATYKIHNGWTKYLARLAMDGKLPDKITWRKDKMGWPDPDEYWFRGELKEWMCTEIENSKYLGSLGLNKDIRKRADGKEPIINLIRLLNLCIWHKKFFVEK